MSKIYNIEYTNGITKITFSDKPTYEVIKSAIDDIAENYSYEKRLWDLTDSNFDFTALEIQRTIKYGIPKFVKPNKVVLVASSDLVYGEGRAFMVYREEKDHTDACVFRTEGEAIEWLNE